MAQIEWMKSGNSNSGKEKEDDKIYSIFLNMLPFTPQTGHFSGASFSTVMPQTGQTK